MSLGNVWLSKFFSESESSSSSSSLDSTNNELVARKTRNNNFNGQKLVNSIELKRRTGAIPKKQQARKARRAIQSSEIVDDVLYISGPVKIPADAEKKQARYRS